ncbi:hypothetical protein [Thioclava sp. IC9]|uniref:hypothetical protein n=1 Tax=Thioclava sp. IC9 TaxID=1973007 RepID=UPI0011314691|nr:hypothetical protein [Thioclava sp. IC9]
MADDSEFLPRVVIESRGGTGSLRVNFKLVGADRDDLTKGAKSILEVFEDWTAYCIASIQHMPGMSSVGYYFADRKIKDEVIEFLKESAIAREEEVVQGEDGEEDFERHSFVIHDDDITAVAQKLSTTSQMLKAARSIQRANLSALIAEFDFLMLRLLTSVCQDFPEYLISDEETISVGLLRSGKSFEDWQAEQIERKISRKLRESHQDLIDWILTDVAKLKDSSKVHSSHFYRDFLEVCQRRHLFIHNGGIVNEDYLEKCKGAGFKIEQLPKIGTALSIDPEYLRSSAARVYLVGAFIIHLVFQSIYSEKRQFSFRALLSASHEFLLSDLTKMAERIIDFAEFNSTKFDHDLRLKFGINRALARLYEPNTDKDTQNKNARQVLDKYDWSVVDPILKLALACVRRDFSDLTKLAEEAHKAGLEFQDANSFCVFREAREIEGFMDCFPRSALLITNKGSAPNS